MAGAAEERDFLIGITAFGAALATGLYAFMQHEWWFGGFYALGGAGGLMWMSPAARSRLGSQPSRFVLSAAIVVTWMFLAANLVVSVYSKWIAPATPSVASSDDISRATAPIIVERDAARRQVESATRERDEARQALANAAEQVRASPPPHPDWLNRA